MTLTRQDVFNKISKSILFGNLGLFVGAGFSKAVLGEDIALSWGELIKKASEGFDIDVKDIIKDGMSFPELSTKICEKIAEKLNISYQEAKSCFKVEICKITNWYPDTPQREIFGKLLKEISPKWIITTNYDLILESLLGDHYISLGPEDYLISPYNITPIYHLHGIRINPESIIVTQEDYIALFRPNVYRQIKLALTMKESTTLILGYNLGDMNVLTAVDWAKNIYEDSNKYPHDIIQVVYSEQPNPNPYQEKNNIIVIETNNLENLLKEFVDYLRHERQSYYELMARLNKRAQDFLNAGPEAIEEFIDNQATRIQVLADISEYNVYLLSPFIDFLSRCIDKTWERAEPYGAFHGYDENLRIILDILITIPYERMPPALFEFLAFSLDRVGKYIGRTLGQSFAAADTWDNYKNNLSSVMVKQLHECSISRNYFNLKQLMKPLLK